MSTTAGLLFHSWRGWVLKWLNEAWASQISLKLAMNIPNPPVMATVGNSSLPLAISLTNLGILCQEMFLRVREPPREDVVILM